MAISVLTPLQLIAGAGLLQNQGLVASPKMTAAINAYKATPVMTAFFQALNAGADIASAGANSAPAFTNSVPSAYANVANIGTQLSTALTTQSAYDFNGDISKFIQAINLSLAYTENTNLFINSAVNSQTYLGNTFTTTNDMITGDITKVNLSTPAFGQDLTKLGVLIDLNNLSDFGSPLALTQRIINVVGNVPVLSIAFLAAGVPQDIIFNLTNPTVNVTDSIQKLMYKAMTQITGDNLNQILKILKVTTTGLETMADLLNPVKIFPTSYQSLTVTTSNGLRAIYVDSTGSVNSKLATELPRYVTTSTA
jgi:hypothetical protein